jgi:REP element-mobilizing transposase RayT
MSCSRGSQVSTQSPITRDVSNRNINSRLLRAVEIGPIQRTASGKVGWVLDQLPLLFSHMRRHGGARIGAGRKRLPPHLRHTPHRSRCDHRASHPVHVTLRAGLRSLRSQRVARTVLGALRDGNRERFRIVHYSVQDNHVHLIVEAESTASLSSGVRGLMVRVARRVNRLLFRRGRFWADRWRGRALTGPSRAKRARLRIAESQKARSGARCSARRRVS